MLSSSAVTTSLAGNLINATITIKQLCSKLQDVSEKITWLVDQLEMLQPMVMDMEASLVNSDAKKPDVAQLCISRCIKALNDLGKISEELKADLDSKSLAKRAKAKAKALMKYDRIQQYQERVGAAVQILILCHQTYLASRSEQQLVTAVVKQLKRHEEEQSPPADRDTSMSTHCQRDAVNTWRISSLLSWQAPNMLGRIRYKSSHTSSANTNIITSQLQLQLPSWLARTTWDVYFQQAQAGWKISLQPTVCFSFDRDLRLIVRDGTSPQLLRYLSENGRGIHGCETNGDTILHIAMRYERFDTAVDLVRAGARLDQPDKSGFTAFTRAAWFAPRNHGSRNSFFQFLAQQGILEDFSESRVSSGALVLKWARWQNVEFFDMLVAMDAGLGRVLWEDIRWEVASASAILALIERRAFADLTYPLSNSTLITPRNISKVALRYFQPRRWEKQYMMPADEHLQGDGSPAAWRSICQLAFRRVSINDLSTAPTTSQLTPLVDAIAYNWNGWVPARAWRQIVLRILRFWLEDLQIAGVHLQGYGNCEQFMLHPYAEVPWQTPWLQHFNYYTPRVARIISGPEPKDWILEWDYFEPRYARDFWELVEWELPPLPGSWVDA